MLPVLFQHAPRLISPGPPVPSSTVSNSLWFTGSLLSWMLTVQRKHLSMCVYWVVRSGEGGEGGRGISFKACSAHCLSNLTHFFHLSSAPFFGSLPLPTPPLHFWSIRHFLPVALFSVSHVNPSRAGAHICQTCIVSALTPPLYCFPDQSGCCISIAAAAFCIFCLIAVSGIWSRPRWVY